MTGSHARTVQEDIATKKRAILISVVISTLLLAIKYTAYVFTGSSAVLSDALESIINVVASGFALFSIYLAAQPADENHPYGHGKIENFSAGFEGAMILLAGLLIVATSAPKFLKPPPIENIGFGTILVAGATAVNLVVGLFLVRQGKKTKSLAIEADGKHLLTDVWTSVGVVAGLFLVKLTGAFWLDPLVAVVLGLNILWQGWRLVRAAAGRLMDEADADLLNEIVEILKNARRPGLLRPHHLRASQFGSRCIVDVHLFMPRFWDLVHVHEEVDRVEDAVRSGFRGDADATIHVDPCRPQHCAACSLSECPVRTSPFVAEEAWTTATIKSTGVHHED
jgi:cation diffusion facilitator family transporter